MARVAAGVPNRPGDDRVLHPELHPEGLGHPVEDGPRVPLHGLHRLLHRPLALVCGNSVCKELVLLVE